MEFRKNKVFRDNVHGYISIPEDYVQTFIDTELFQRLRYIEQTGMRVLYPSSRHDRFIHSLGVYYLGAKAFSAFRKNTKSSYADTHYSIVESHDDNELFWDYCQIMFEIACLMHDCAHSPFSHTLEHLYDYNYTGVHSLNRKMITQIDSKDFNDDFKGHGGPHERMSALLVCSQYDSAIKGILEKYHLDKVNDNYKEFICRMIIGCPYKKSTKGNFIKNCLISLLNSDSIDVDSLDYIIRDAKMSGIDNTNIDVDRLLSSITIVEMTEFNNDTLENAKISATVMYGTLENAEIEGKSNGKIVAENNCKSSFHGTVDLKGNVKITNIATIKANNHMPKRIRIGGAYMESLEGIKSETNTVEIQGILNKDMGVEGNELTFHPDTNVIIKLSAKKIDFDSTYIDGVFSGNFRGAILGNYSDLTKGNVKCVLGFHKSSLSVIQNVILARNYEYQWVYSHHKVVYYSNYLIIELLNKCLQNLKMDYNKPRAGKDKSNDRGTKIISWQTMMSKSETDKDPHPLELFGEKFWRPTDADILSLFKKYQISAGSGTKLQDLLLQFTTRDYRKSLWKSYAEMHSFLSEFTQNEIEELFELFVENSVNKHTEKYKQFDSKLNKIIEKTRKVYGYLNKEWKQKFYSFNMQDVVWVNGDSKMKKLDPNKTFIKFKDKDMTLRSVSSPDEIHSMERLHLFYVYYKPVDEKEIKQKEILKFLRQKLAEATPD